MAHRASMKSAARLAIQGGDIGLALELWSEITRGETATGDLLEHFTVLHRLYRSSESVIIGRRLLLDASATPEELLAAARLWFQLGRFTECSRYTGKALELLPGCPDTAALHAAALERSGMLDEACKVINRTISSNPGHPRLVRLRAHIERRMGDFEAANTRLESQLRQFPTNEDWRIRYELAAVLDRLGCYEQAMDQLEDAKSQIKSESARLRSAWRSTARRQWEVTERLSYERLAKWRVQDRTESSPPICLMPGFPRSGTTLLEQIVTRHSQCIGTDESGILALEFRDPMILAASSADAAIEELDALEPEDLAAGREEYLRCTEDVVGETIGARMLVEKDPLLTADLAIPLRLFPDCRILMPLRDPRDVVISFFFTIVPLAPNSVASSTLEDTCRYYAEVMRHWLLLRDRIDPTCWMESRYEDLLEDPEAQTRRITGFLGLPWESSILTTSSSPNARAVRTPTYDDVSRPLFHRSNGRWKHYQRWLEPYLHYLHPFLDAFGYR